MSRRLPYIDLPATHSFIERGSGANVVGTCSKGEFLKCTEDDQAGRIRMAAGVPFFYVKKQAPLSGNTCFQVSLIGSLIFKPIFYQQTVTR